MTNREFVSTVEGKLNDYQLDDRIPRRLILATGLDISTTLHSQKLLDKTLDKEDNLFTKLSCVKMMKVSKNACGVDLKRCGILMRSVDKLPKTLYSRFGNSVIMVTNVTETKYFNKKEFTDITASTPGRYSNLLPSKPVWFVFNDYLWIMDFEIQMVNVYLLSLQKDETTEDGTIGECTDHWDLTFVCSDKLREPVARLTVESLVYPRQIVKDESPDLDSNIKTK